MSVQVEDFADANATTSDVEMFGPEGDNPQPARPVGSDDEMADLFGEGDAEGEEEKAPLSRDSSPTPSVLGSDGDGLTSAQRRQRQAMEYGEDDADAEPDVVQLREAEVPIPNLPLPTTSDGNHWVIRMPNFVKIDPQPFHPDTYRGPEADLDLADQAETLRERSMSIKLEVENTVRWKWITGDNDEKRRLSNSRMIRWSDGSMSLQLGKELFDVSVNIDNSATIPRAGAGQGAMPTTSSQPPPTPSAKQAQDSARFPIEPQASQGLSYLVAQHKTSAILQVEAPVAGFLSLRPTGMQSETHRKLVRAVGQKHNKVARLRIAPEMTRDPERVNAELAKAAGKQRRSRAGQSRRTRDSSADGADEDSDGDVGGRKKRRRSSFGRGRSSRNVYSDDDDEEPEAEATDDDEPQSTRKRRDTAKPRGDPGDYEADDFVVDDPSDNEDEGDSRRANRDEDDGEPDELDKIDRQIENQSRSRRKEAASSQKVKDEDMGGGSDDMDMSNSDEEEAETVRKPAPGRKKIIIDDDDDE